MAGTTPSLKATDLLAVKSRVSWGAISAGAMVALAVYFLLSLLGLAVGIEMAMRRGIDRPVQAGTAIYSLLTLLLSMFLGGWTVSRLAVGETKLEAVLYGVILWGVLFVGMFWLIGAGIRVGFGSILSGAVAVNSDDPSNAMSQGAVTSLIDRYNSNLGGDKFVDDLKKAGVDQEQAQKIQKTLKDRLDTLKNDPASLKDDPQVQQVGAQAADFSRQAAWYSLAGVVISMAAVILGSLIGSGDLPVPVPILGVRRHSSDPRM